MAKQILITGALGFLGRHAARSASRAGHRVIGIGRGQWSESFAREWGFVDGRSWPITTETLDALKCSPDWILHCAGSGSAAASAQSPMVSLEDNIATAASVLEYARARAGKVKVVLVSSAAVYGDAGRAPIAESQATRPLSVYGNHKALAEDLARWYAREHRLAVGIVRFFSLYGPGLRRELLWNTCEQVARGDSRHEGNGDETYDLLHADDAVALLALAAEAADSQCPIWNGGRGEAVTARELVTAIARRFQAPVPVFSGTLPKGQPRFQVAAIARSRSLGFSPRMEWRTGVDEYVAWYRSQQSTQLAAA